MKGWDTYYAYRMEHTATGRYYVGVRTWRGRPEDDVNYLGSGSEIRRWIAQHGPAAFTKSILATFSDKWEMMRYEREVVTLEMVADPKCLNLVTGGGGCGGKPLKPEVRARISAAHKGKPKSPETVAKMRAAWERRKARGWTHSAEARAKMSAALIGRKVSPEAIEKTAVKNRGRKPLPHVLAALRLANTNRVFSPERRARMAAAHKGKKPSAETIARMSATMKGRKLSDEHRAAMRAAWVIRKAKKAGGVTCSSTP